MKNYGLHSYNNNNNYYTKNNNNNSNSISNLQQKIKNGNSSSSSIRNNVNSKKMGGGTRRGLEPLEFEECIVDSPEFRDNLNRHEKELDHTSHQIKRIIKEVKDLMNAAKGEFNKI